MYQAVTSKPGMPDSIIVGYSGACGERWADVTASAFRRPACTKGSDVLMVSNMMETWPPISAISAGALPL